MPSRPPQPVPVRPLLVVGAVALLLRLLHNQALLADPLYWNPLGGNLPLLIAGEAIAGGDPIPFDGPISLNSPLYPYLLAGLYEVFGTNAFFEVRLAGAAADSLTCVLVGWLAWRRFGQVAGWSAGLILAAYGPLIFFSTDLNPVPFALLLLTAAVALLDVALSPDPGLEGAPKSRRAAPNGPAPGRLHRPEWATWLGWAGAGLLFGVATGLRPNLLLAGVLALALPWLGRSGGPRLPRALALLAGLAVGIAPVTAVNFAASGRFVPLTTSAGHNLYIGHNPLAEAQYTLPAALDGDIFESMKGLAEEVEGRALDDTEVSAWYTERAIEHVVADPVREVELLGRRALLLVNDVEATTYANVDYQRWYSSVLRWAPSFVLLVTLALPGALLAWRRELAHLWIPLAAGAAAVLLFFYIARLRILAVPTLGIFAGAAVGRAVALAREREWRPLLAAALVGVVAAAVSLLPLLRPDASNEWNKAGGVLRLAERWDAADAAFDRAERANPQNPNTWRNRALLYRDLGRPEAAEEAEARARLLAGEQPDEAARYRRALEGR